MRVINVSKFMIGRNYSREVTPGSVSCHLAYRAEVKRFVFISFSVCELNNNG